MLAEGLIVGYRVLDLPSAVVALERNGRGVVFVVVTREVVLLQGSATIAPEREFGAIGEVILQCIPQLQVDRELGHELVAPVLIGVTVHHGDWVVLLLITADESGYRVGVAVLIPVQVVSTVAVDHLLCDVAPECYGQGGSQIQGRTQGRAPGGVGLDAGAMHAHIREVSAQVQLVQEVALLGGINEVEHVVGADGQTVIV